jgi:predicted RNA polymerase sigma factor
VTLAELAERVDALERQLDRIAAARAEFERAVTLTQDARERSVLPERIASRSARG